MYLVAKPKNEDHVSCLAYSHLAWGEEEEEEEEAWNFPKSKSPYRAGKLVFFIFLHISLRKFRAVLLPRGSLGEEGPIEGLEIFLSLFRGL